MVAYRGYELDLLSQLTGHPSWSIEPSRGATVDGRSPGMTQIWLLPKHGGPHFGSPWKKDQSIFGYIVGLLIYENSHILYCHSS